MEKIMVLTSFGLKLLVKKLVLGNPFISQHRQKKILEKVGIRILTEEELPPSVKRKLGLVK